MSLAMSDNQECWLEGHIILPVPRRWAIDERPVLMRRRQDDDPLIMSAFTHTHTHIHTHTVDFEPIFARSASAVTPNEKSLINTNRKFTTRFSMRLRWPSYTKGASKTQNGRLPSKIALRLKRVCYKVSLCENCQRQSCKAFIGLTNCVKMISGRRPLLLEILNQTDRVWAKSWPARSSDLSVSEMYALQLYWSYILN